MGIYQLYRFYKAIFMVIARVGGLGGHEPHISDLRTPLLAKLTYEPHTSGSESHTSGLEPNITVSSKNISLKLTTKTVFG